MRAQLYSIIALTIIVPVVVFFYHASSTERKWEYETITSTSMYELYKNILQDFERALFISGKRAAIALNDFVIVNNVSLSDARKNMSTLMEEGRINGSESILMVNNTLYNWTKKMEGVETPFLKSFNYSNLSLTEDGFFINLSATFHVSITDKKNITEIKKSVLVKTGIDVNGFEDPLYAINTYGLVLKVIRKSPYGYRGKKLLQVTNAKGYCRGAVTFDPNDPEPSRKILIVNSTEGIENLLDKFAGAVVEKDESLNITCFASGNDSAIEAINSTVTETGYEEVFIDNDTKVVWHLPINDEIKSGYYFEEDAPGLLERLENNLTRTKGFASFVNLAELSMAGIPLKPGQITLDYLYFSDENYIGSAVRGLPEWFRLNYTLAKRYGIEELLE